MTIDTEKVYRTAKQLMAERGHGSDLTDLDQVVEDAIDLAKMQVSTDDVLRVLDTLIVQA